MDARVRPLIYTIRAWAKAKGLSGRGGGQLSNYALTLMILYYLQTLSPPVIPCLQDLETWPSSQADGVKMTEQTLEGWDCSYVDDISALSRSQNVEVAGNSFANDSGPEIYGSFGGFWEIAVGIRGKKISRIRDTCKYRGYRIPG